MTHYHEYRRTMEAYQNIKQVPKPKVMYFVLLKSLLILETLFFVHSSSYVGPIEAKPLDQFSQDLKNSGIQNDEHFTRKKKKLTCMYKHANETK